MAKLQGGLFGRPSGQLMNLVIGAARDRTGKIPTVREKTPPTNPNTAPQQGQRGKFKDSLQIVRDIGPTEYQGAWNRAIGQLPGFQSLMSIMLNAMGDDFVLTEPPVIPLGPLHSPLTLSGGQGSSTGTIDLTWSTELGSDGTAADVSSIFAIRADRDSDNRHPVYQKGGTTLRSAGTYTMTGLTSAETYLLWLYFDGAGLADGKISAVKWVIATAE